MTPNFLIYVLLVATKVNLIIGHGYSVPVNDNTGKLLADISTVSFKEDSYVGELNLKYQKIEKLPVIELKNPHENVQGRIESGEYEDKFYFGFNPKTNSFELEFINPIDYKNKNFISFKVEAYVGNNVVAKAKVVLILINKEFIRIDTNNIKADLDLTTNTISIVPSTFLPRFLKDSYQGEIDLSTEKIEELPEIIIENSPKSVTGRIEQGEYQGKFNVIFNNETKTFQIVPTKPLDFVDKQVISFKLEAIYRNHYTIASTIVILTVTNKRTQKFSQDSYEGELNFHNRLIEKLPIIKMDNPLENVKGRIEVGEYEELFYFGFNTKTNTFELEFMEALDYSFYRDKNFISFNVEAYVGNTVVAKAKFVLTLINKPIIRFSRNIYRANLDLTTNTISLPVNIFVYGDDSRRYTASIPEYSGYDKNFDIKIESKWFITLQVNKNNPIKYTGDKFIHFEIEVRIDDNEFSRVWIIMQLLNAPQFEESLYKGEIDFQLKTLTHPQIYLRYANQAVAKTDFELDSSGGDRFSAYLQNGTVTLKLMDENVYADYDDAFITIIIKAIVDNYVMSSTVLVLENVGNLDPCTSTKIFV